MPNTSSAKKALRVSKRKAAINKVKDNKIKDALKTFRKELAKGKGGKNLAQALSSAQSAISKAAKSNYIPKSRASRKISRLSAQAKKVATAK